MYDLIFHLQETLIDVAHDLEKEGNVVVVYQKIESVKDVDLAKDIAGTNS